MTPSGVPPMDYQSFFQTQLDALKTEMLDFGTADDAPDGAPVRPISITRFTLQ